MTGKKSGKQSINKAFRKESWRAGNMLYPAPAVMVSSLDSSGRANICTVAWAGTICSDPAMVSISVRPERYSYDCIREHGEFVINLVTEGLAHACDWCGVRSGRDYDKFKETGLTKYISEFMQTPAICESPVNIYCKVRDIVHLGTHDMFIAEVTGVTVDSSLLNERGTLMLDKAKLIAYSHGGYFGLGRCLGTFGYSVRKKSSKHSSGK